MALLCCICHELQGFFVMVPGSLIVVKEGDIHLLVDCIQIVFRLVDSLRFSFRGSAAIPTSTFVAWYFTRSLL